jgi:hypothetical protein
MISDMTHDAGMLDGHSMSCVSSCSRPMMTVSRIVTGAELFFGAFFRGGGGFFGGIL